MQSLDANDLAGRETTSYLSLLIIYTKDKRLCLFYFKQAAIFITGNAIANPIHSSYKFVWVFTTEIYDAFNQWMPCGEVNLEQLEVGDMQL